MPTSALSTVVDAVYTLLEGANIGATVYRFVEQPPAFPYITIAGATENRRDRMGKADKTLLIPVHVFTSSDVNAGFAQPTSILAAINSAVDHAPLTLTGFVSALCRPEDALDAGDDIVDGVRYPHWIQHVRVIAEES
jgi:hypothetical protein